MGEEKTRGHKKEGAKGVFIKKRQLTKGYYIEKWAKERVFLCLGPEGLSFFSHKGRSRKTSPVDLKCEEVLFQLWY